MDEHAKKALNATKGLHTRLRELENDMVSTDRCNPDFKKLKKLAADANKAVQAMQRHASDEAVRADVSLSILREAVRDDLIDREANAARVLDKQRGMLECNPDAASAFERAHAAANAVESAVIALCPHQTRHASGVALLAEAAGSSGSCSESDGP